MGIKYRCGFKYQLALDYMVQTGVIRDKKKEKIICTDYVTLFTDGQMLIRKGFAWDGASSIARDTKTIMRGSLIHDALYSLLRTGKLDMKWREQSDMELWKACCEDGMWRLRAWWVHRAVRKFAKFAALPENRKEILEAP